MSPTTDHSATNGLSDIPVTVILPAPLCEATDSAVVDRQLAIGSARAIPQSTTDQATEDVAESSSNPDRHPQKSDAHTSWLGRALQAVDRLIPNRMVMVGIPLGVGIEMALLGQVAVPVYQAGWSMAVAVTCFVTWFWITGCLCLHRITRRLNTWRHTTTAWKGRTAIAGLSLAATLGVLAYAVSWGLFLQTSRFANWEVLSFALANQRDLWLYVTQAEPIHLVRGLGIVAVGLIALPSALPYLGQLRYVPAGAPIHRNRLWVWATIATVLGVLPVMQDESHRRRSENVASLSHSLNPALAFATSILESLLSEPVKAKLVEEELVPLSASWSPPPMDGNRPSIIIVAVESLRSDVVYQVHQGREITPNINRLARAGLQWTNAYSQSTHSDYADICIVSSLYPLRTRQHHYYTANDPWPKQLIYDSLKPAGYKTAIISSQNEMWGGMEHFLATPALDYFYHPQRSTETHLGILPERDLGFAHEVYTGHLKIGKFPDRHTADKAIAWVEQQANTGEPFFLSMNLQSSHFPFAMPDDVPRPFQPCELDPDVMFMIYPEHRTPKVRNAYFNALHEADRNIGRLVETLERLKLDDKVVLLVIGENGEAFHENNTVGHGREPYEPAIHVATVMWGKQYVKAGVETYPLEHIDLVPTIYGLLGWQPHPNFQGIDVLSPNRPPLNERLLFFHTRSPSSFCDAVQYAGRWKYMWSFDYDNGTLCDLQSDPTESIDLSEKYPELTALLHQTLMEWRAKQLAYYHFPFYYQKYYPPAPPRWPVVGREFVPE